MSEARQVDDNYEGPDRLRLKIAKGKSATIRCVGQPIAFDDTYTDPDTQESKTTEKYARVVIVRGEPDSVKGFRYGWQVFKGIRSLAQKPSWGDPSGYDIEIECTGELPDYWKVTPVEKKPLTDAEAQMVKDAKIDLGVLFLGKKPEDVYDPFVE